MNQRPKYHCVKCGHDWTGKKKGVIPQSCPRCKSYKYAKGD
jgi:predicted Zn-ribbon and HTH transcriptional regulator